MAIESWFEYVAFRILRLFRRLHLTRLIRVGPTRMFMDYFKDYEKVAAVRGIFGEKTEEVLRNLRVEFIGFGYMGVDDTDGHLLVNARYLKTGDKTDIYLDIVHELCHVKQFMDGKELFDPHYDYVDRPTEVEAYRYAVKEARRLGLSDERIFGYLKTEWMSTEDLKRLAKTVDVKC
jgi:hypothetical protein